MAVRRFMVVSDLAVYRVHNRNDLFSGSRRARHFIQLIDLSCCFQLFLALAPADGNHVCRASPEAQASSSIVSSHGGFRSGMTICEYLSENHNAAAAWPGFVPAPVTFEFVSRLRQQSLTHHSSVRIQTQAFGPYHAMPYFIAIILRLPPLSPQRQRQISYTDLAVHIAHSRLS